MVWHLSWKYKCFVKLHNWWSVKTYPGKVKDNIVIRFIEYSKLFLIQILLLSFYCMYLNFGLMSYIGKLGLYLVSWAWPLSTIWKYSLIKLFLSLQNNVLHGIEGNQCYPKKIYSMTFLEGNLYQTNKRYKNIITTTCLLIQWESWWFTYEFDLEFKHDNFLFVSFWYSLIHVVYKWIEDFGLV